MSGDETVYVSRERPWLSYHDGETLAVTWDWDMQAVTKAAAEDAGAIPCSHCFPDAGPIYEYPYMGGVDD